MHVQMIRRAHTRLAWGLGMFIAGNLLLNVQPVSAAEKKAPAEVKKTPAVVKTAPIMAKTAPVVAKAAPAVVKTAPAEVKKAPAEEKKARARGKNAPPPDYTKGEDPVDYLYKNAWTLGATGAYGKFWYREPRMIQIVRVDAGAPADGKLKMCDVILGVGASTNFTSDAHRALSAAITEAEKSSGKLLLTVWRPVTETKIINMGKKGNVSTLAVTKPISGQVLQVTLNLPVKGAFSATAPWNCEKSKVLVNDAAEAIAKREPKDISDLDALGLLATGEKKYLPLVASLAQEKAKWCEAMDIMAQNGVGSWDGGYLNILLTEYYLLTKDEKVLPGIKSVSEYMAYGQSGVGTWSHGMAYVKGNGLYGPSAVYGSMNSASLPIAMSLVLAQKCGITTQPVNDAVNRSRKFYKYYVDKGCIPYGEHPPAMHHDNNGRMSMAAVFFDLLGDKEATKYFTRMTLASYNTREGGHTGHFFAWQWGALAAARGGPAAAAAFVEKTRYFTELERHTDGSSVYQPMLNGANKYYGRGTTGQRLMQNCLPRKVLYITGKVDSCTPPFTSAEVKDAVDAATFNPAGLPVKELLAKLGSWSMIVRDSAAQELGTREDNVVEELIAMLDGPDRYARYGAATALRYCGRQSDKAVDALVNKIENDKDTNLRFFAVNALKIPDNSSPKLLGSAAKKAVPALLKIAAASDPENDPNRTTSGQISGMFFYSGNVQGFKGYFPDGKGTENLDRKLLIPAMKAFLTNPDGGARSQASCMLDKMKEEDLNQLWPEIYYAVKYQAPANAMFAGAVRGVGLKLMSDLGIEEAIPLGIDFTLRQDGWGHGNRVALRPLLLKYGKALEGYVPEIETILAGWEKGLSYKNRPGTEKAFRKELADALAKPAPALKSIKPFLDKSGMKDQVKVFPPNKDGSPRKVVQTKDEGEEAQTPEEFKPKEGGGGE